MAKNDNSHAIRLHSALSEYVGSEKADRFAELHPLGKSADVSKKAVGRLKLAAIWRKPARRS